MRITFLGAGNMGTTLAKVASEEGSNEVILWSIEEEVVNSINKTGVNKKYLPGVRLKDNVKSVHDAGEGLKNADIVVFSVPSHAVREVCENVEEDVPRDAVVVDVAKGLEQGTSKRMSEVIKEYLNNPLIAVGGPSIANELARENPTFVVYAGEDKSSVELVKNAFETSYYKICTSGDVAGVELCGALKNVIAILAGYHDGLGHGMNTKSGVITKGIEELTKVGEELGAEPGTITGLAGLGDLIVTCSSEHSRNRRFGQALGEGLTQEEALNRIGQVVEGRRTVRVTHEVITEHGLECALMEKVYNLVIKNEKINT